MGIGYHSHAFCIMSGMVMPFVDCRANGVDGAVVQRSVPRVWYVHGWTFGPWCPGFGPVGAFSTHGPTPDRPSPYHYIDQWLGADQPTPNTKKAPSPSRELGAKKHANHPRVLGESTSLRAMESTERNRPSSSPGSTLPVPPSMPPCPKDRRHQRSRHPQPCPWPVRLRSPASWCPG